MTPYSPLKMNRHLEEHVASIFRAEEKTKQETSMKQAARKASCKTSVGFQRATQDRTF
jgi:hypothetical protein